MPDWAFPFVSGMVVGLVVALLLRVLEAKE
jgi:hypothetical protein